MIRILKVFLFLLAIELGNYYVNFHTDPKGGEDEKDPFTKRV